MGVKVKSSYQEEDEEKKQAQQEIKAEPEPAKTETPAPASAPVVNTGSRGIPKLNRAQRTTIGQNHALRDTDFTIETPSALENLPEALEPRRAEYEQKEREGKLAGSASHNWGTRQVSVEINSIKDEQQLAYFTSTLDSDADKLSVFKAWAEHNDKSYDDVLYGAEQLLGDALFKKPKSTMGVLSDLADVNGNAININTASSEMVVQGIQGIADADERKAAAKALQTLCYRKGSRFYGYELPDDLDTFRDSYSLTQTQYNSLAKEYRQLFKQGDGNEEFNAEQYHLKRQSIMDNENYDALAKRNLVKALDHAYFGVTYAEGLPQEPKQKTAEESADTPQEQNRGEDKGMLARAADAVGGFVDSVVEFFGGDEEQEEAETPAAEQAAQEVTPSEAEPEEAPAEEPEAAPQEAELPEPEATEKAEAAGPPKLQQTDAAVEERAAVPASPSGGASVALFTEAVLGDRETPGMDQVRAQQNAAQYIPVADAGEALELMYQGKGNLIAPEDRAYIDELMKDQNVRKLHGALDDQAMKVLEVGNEPAEFITNRSLSSFGTTIYGAYQDIMSDDFPKELRGDSMMILTEIVHAAGQAYAKGQLVCPEGANSFETYLDANPAQREKIQSIYGSWEQLIENENKIRAEYEQKSEKALSDARAAVLNGQYSDEQLAMVQENAVAEWQDVLVDETRAQMNFQINRNYFEPVYGGFEQTSVYKNMAAHGITDTGSFKASIKSEMHALLDEDTETALSLGLTLDEYYTRIGGMSLDQLAQRANIRMQQQGASITPEEKDVLVGTGDGVGVVAATGYGVARGAQNWWGSFNDSLYKGMTQAGVSRNAEKMTGYYQTEFGPYGRDYYREDLMALINSGDLTEEYAKALQTALDTATDIYDIGIDPTAWGGLRSTAKQMRGNVEQMDTYMAKNGTPGENRWYGYVGAMTENTISAGVAAGGAVLTGSAGAGFFLGYDVNSYGQNYDARLAQGYSLNSASHMAAWDTAASHLANSGTFSKIYGQFSGATTLERAGWFEALGKNPSGAMKAKAAVKTFVTTAAGNVFDEAVSDELKENIAAQAADAMFGPIYRKIDAGEDIGAADVVGALLNVTDVDLMKAGKETAGGFVDAAITSSLFALVGVTGKTFRSVVMAKDIVAGKSSDVQGFIEAAKEDLSNPEIVTAINEDAHAQQIDEATVNTLIRDDGSDGKMAQAQKLQEQADSHAQEAEASAMRVEEGWKHYDEQKAAGNMQAAVEALEDIDKAEQGLKEHERERDQKTLEANQVREEKMQDARKAATLKLAQEADAMRAQIQSDTEGRKRTLDAEIEDVEAQMAAIEERIAQADADDDMAAFDELMQKRSDLEDRRIALLGEAQETEAVQDARNAAESALNAQDEAAAAAMQQAAEQEKIAEEKAALAPVFRDLRTRAIYVDEQQAAEIKNATGLTIPQFNRKYGFSLTTNKAKKQSSLDGSFFADLAEQAPGYIDAQTAHPEEAIVALAQRKKELAGVQASIGSADAEAYITETTEGTQDPVTQKMASDLYKKTGIKLVTANLADGTRGWFDRANGQLVLSNKLGAGELRRVVVLHELTHFIEKSKGYEEYKAAVLEAAYAGGEEYRAQMLERDREDIREEYSRHGVTLSESELDAELVAAATETVIGGDEQFFEQLISDGKRSFIKRVYMKLRTFLNRQKAKKASPEARAQYDAIQKAHDLMEQALRKSAKLTGNETGSDPTVAMSELTQDVDNRPTEQTQMQYSLGWTRDGRQYVEIEEDILEGRPENEWPKAARDALRKFSDGIPVGNNTINVSQKTYGEWMRSKDTMRTKRTNAQAYEDKMRAANNADEIIWASTDYVNEEAAHGRTDGMQDFGRGKVLMDIGGNGYQADVLVGQKENGELLLYDVTYIEPADIQKKKTQNSSSSRESVPTSQTASSDTIVPDNGSGVKNQSMPNSVQKSIGIRQFGNNTMQRADFIEDRVKELVKDSEYERDTNRAQVKRATDQLDRNGLEATAAMLMNKEKSSYTADDNALAFVSMAEATRTGDSVTAAMLAMRMLEESTEQGRALQSLKIGLKLTPEGAMGETLRKAKEHNAKRKNTDSSFIPTGNEAPKGKKGSGSSNGSGAGMPASTYSAAGSGGTGSGRSGPASTYSAAGSGVRLNPDNDPSVGWTGDEVAPDDSALQETMLDAHDGWLDDDEFTGPQLAPDAEGEQERVGPAPAVDTGEIHHVPQYIQDVYAAADTLKARLDKLSGETSRDNPWGLPMNAAQMELAKKYGLMGTALPSDYAHATLKQRMLSAIIATPDGVRGDGLLTLCQQLEFMKEGYAVVTEADLNYIAGQMSEVIAQGGVENEIPKTREGQIALSRVYDAQANITPTGRMDQFRSWTYANMLSSPATWVRNVASNVLMDPLEAVSTGIGTLADMAVAKKTGTRTTGIAAKEDRKAGRMAFKSEAAKTFEDYFITHTDTGHGRKYDINQAGRGRTFQNGMLEAGKTMVDFAMQIGDRPFYEKCYAEELAIIKRLGMKVNEGGVLRDMTAEEMHEEATMRATKRVFQEDGTISRAIGQLQQSPFWGTVANMVVPFVKTPTNIAARLMDYSPVGLAKAIIKDGLWDMKYNNGAGFDQRRFVMNLGRGLTGTGLTAAGVLLAGIGALKFGYSDEEDEKTRGVRKALGEPYGMYIQIGDTKHEIDWALPGAGGLVIGANLLRNLANATDNADVISALTKGVLSSTWNEMFNSSMLSAFNDVFRGYGDATGIAERFIQTSANSLVSRLTPSWVRAVAKATDPYVRDTSDSDAIWASLKQNLVQSWPIMRQMLPIKTDLTGDQQLQSGYWNPEGEHGNAIMQYLDSFLTPTATIGEKNDPELLELLDLSYRTKESSFLPTELISANKYELKLNKSYASALGYAEAAITMELTDEEKRAANTAYGNLLFNGDGGRAFKDEDNDYVSFPGLRAVMNDKARYGDQEKAWSKMTDAERTELVADMVADAKKLMIVDVARQKKEDGEI